MEPPRNESSPVVVGAPLLSPSRVEGFRFDAFASYSTGADYRLVREVEGFLESFHQLPKPAGDPLPALEVCVDGSDFSIAGAAAEAARQPGASKEQIEGEIQQVVARELGRSRRLLIFCPGRDRQGRWMDWEIDWWENNRGWDSILLVITGGRDPWKDPPSFFPEAVIRHGLHGRIAYDLRANQSWWRRWGWKGVRDFDEELSRLAADLYLRSLGEVLPVWYRQRRRRQRLVIRISVSVALFMVMLASFAVVQRNLAESRRLVAERQTRLATTRLLAAESGAALGQGFPQRSLLLGAEALEVTHGAGEPHVIQAEQALRDALARAGGTPLAGHQSPVETLSLSADGKWLATGGEDGQVLLWDLEQKKSLPLEKRGSAVNEARFSADGRWLVTVRRDGTVKVWDGQAGWSKGARITDGPGPAIVKVLFSAQSRWLAVTREGSGVMLHDLQAPDAPPRQLRKHRNPVTDLAFTPDGNRLVTASDKQHYSEARSTLSEEEGADVWDLRDPKQDPELLLGHDGAVECLEVSPGGRWLITGGHDGEVAVWDLTAKPIEKKWALTGHSDRGVGAVAVASGDRWLASGGHDGTVRLWDLQAVDPAAAPVVYTGHSGTVHTVEFSHDGRRLLTHTTGDSDVQLQEMGPDGPGSNRWVLRGHTGEVRVARFADDGRWVLTAGDDKVARLWDLQADDPAKAPLVFAGHEDSIGAEEISPNGRWLAVGSGPLEFSQRRDNQARVWDLRMPQPAASPELWPAGGVSPDEAWVATSTADFKVRLWRRRDGSVFLLEGATERFSAILFSSDTHWLAAASEDGTGRLWDLTQSEPGKRAFFLQPKAGALLRAAFSPDGRWLATGDNENLAVLWDLRAEDPARAGHQLRGHEDGIMDLTWSADSRRLATGSADRTAKIWDVSGGAPTKPLWTLEGHAEYVNRALFSPEGRWLVTTELYRGAVRVWDLQAPDPSLKPAARVDHQKEVQAIEISPDGRWLASASREEKVKLQALPPPGLAAGVIELPPLMSFAREPVVSFSQDGRWLATNGENNLAYVWDLHAQPLGATPYRILGGHENEVFAFIFTRDGNGVISASADGTARLWSLTAAGRGEPPVIFPVGNQSFGLGLGDGGKQVIVEANDAVRIWPLGAESLGELARRTAGRKLRADEAATLLPAGGNPERGSESKKERGP